MMTDYERHELLLKAKPILFNTDMVRAILDGRKTVTRRVLKPQPEKAHNIMDYDNDAHTVDFHCGNCTTNGTFIDWTKTVKAPYWFDDILYVRETWKQATTDYAGGGYGLTDLYLYKADKDVDTTGMMVEGKWHSPVQMPKEAARIFLRVTDVRVERLQDIPDEDMLHDFDICPEAVSIVGKDMLAELVWNATVKKSNIDKYGWAANPFVWVIEFERID